MKLITKKDLKNEIEKNKILENSSITSFEGIKYDLRISSKILKGDYKRTIDINTLSDIEKTKMVVEPGELVFTLTEELINLPNDITAFIGLKRKMPHEGIMVLGGTTVDPLYKGRLIFGMYNFSSTTFPIKQGKKIASIMFYRLEGNEVDAFIPPEIFIEDDFPEIMIERMSRFKGTSNQQLTNNLNQLTAKILQATQEIEKIKKDIVSKELLEKIGKAIEKTNVSLQEEISEREKSMVKLKNDFNERDEKLNKTIRGVYKFLAGVATAAAITFLAVILSVYLKQ